MQRFRSLLLAATVGLTAALSSCSSARYFDFTTASSRQSAYHPSAPVVASAPSGAATPEAFAIPDVAAPDLTASAAPFVEPAAAAPAATARTAAPAQPRLSEQLATARGARQLTRVQERRYEHVLDRVQKEEARREATGQQVDALELILAIFLPPIGVLVHEKGQLTSHFWISLLLTILFFIPGMIYSILIVTDTI